MVQTFKAIVPRGTSKKRLELGKHKKYKNHWGMVYGLFRLGPSESWLLIEESQLCI
ncbi:MAG: hypothetical protein LBI95_02695 [Holosporales bacterium]|jgi:hypothetical protein|nr:hypothetical protein [Holosporales bacterium]